MKKYLEERMDELEMELTLIKETLKLDKEKDTSSLDKITFSKSDMESISPDQQHLCFEDYPEYPNFLGSFDSNPEDVIK
jgi:predicted Rossmann fold nucleotide-binding protein DprA/Smf involved in DNA uptake